MGSHIDMDHYFVISQTDGRPMYLQIMEQIKQRVAVGDWQPGDKIPSIRELAVALQVSVITIKRAYLELEREGVIVTRQGMGSSIAENTDLGKKLYQEELEKHLDRVAELGRILGLDAEELQARLRQVYNNIKEQL